MSWVYDYFRRRSRVTHIQTEKRLCFISILAAQKGTRFARPPVFPHAYKYPRGEGSLRSPYRGYVRVRRKKFSKKYAEEKLPKKMCRKIFAERNVQRKFVEKCAE